MEVRKEFWTCMEMKLQMAVSHHAVLETEPGSFARAVRVRTISPAPGCG